MDHHADKKALRARMKMLRAELYAKNPHASFHCAAHIKALNLKGVVAGYFPINSELDPMAALLVLSGMGLDLCLPCLEGEGAAKNMLFRRFSFQDELTSGPMGTKQPSPDKSAVLPDVVLVPLLGFDAKGGRLGYGGGYYDRALAFLRAKKQVMAIGMAFSQQEVYDLALEPHDQPLDAALTEDGFRRFGN